jgi:hypothetical protein
MIILPSKSFSIYIFLEQNKTSLLAEKETFYKQQLREYQATIDQITRQEQNVLFLFRQV